MEKKSALSVFNDAMSLAKKLNCRYSQREELEEKAFIFMIHHLLKGEKFPVDDWFPSWACHLFEAFLTYYSKHDCWEGFKKNILNCAGKMYGLFVAAVYCQEQANEERKKACVQSLLHNTSINDKFLNILSEYAYQYPVLLDVLEQLLKKQTNLRDASVKELWDIYQEYHEDEYWIALKSMDVLYLWLTRLQRPVDVCADYVNFLYFFRQQPMKLTSEEQQFHLQGVQKVLRILSLKKSSPAVCKVVSEVLDTPSFKIGDRLALVETYLDDFVDAARESDLIAGLSSRIANEETCAKMLSLLAEIQQKVSDNRRLVLDLLELIVEAWREETCERLHIIARESLRLEKWEHIDAYLKRGVFSPREEKWLELCCKAANFAAGDVSYFQAMPLWFALKLKKLIATYPVLEKFKDYAEQIFDEQMEVLENFLEEDCNYISWKEWERVLDEFWCEATASEIAKLIHLLAGYESVDSPMKVWAKGKNFGFTNWGEKQSYTSQVVEMLNALNVD